MEVKILKNIKYNNSLYRKGEVIDIEDNDIKEFTDKNIINNEELEEIEKYEENEEDDFSKQALSEDDEDVDTIAYDDLTKTDIVNMLGEKGIDHNPRDPKQKLYDLLLGSE